MTKFSRRTLIATSGCALLATQIPSAFANAKQELRVTAAPATSAELYQALARGFEKKYPDISVKLEVSQPDYNAQLAQTLRDNLVGRLPDVSIQGNNILRNYIERDMAVPLDDLFNAELASPQTTLSQSVGSIGHFGGKTYGLGLTVSVPVAFYNLDLVKKAGWDPENLPTTWDAIFDLAQKIQNLPGDALGAYFVYDQADWFWMALLESQGVSMMNQSETKLNFAGPEGLKAMEIIKKFGELGQSKVDMDRHQSRHLFASGNVGILLNSSSSLKKFEQQSAGNFEMGTGPFPLLSDHAHQPAGGTLGVIFAQDPERQKAAWAFLKFAAGAEGQEIIAKNSGYVVANDLAAKTPDMLGDFFARDKNYAPIIKVLPLVDGWYSYPGENGPKITDVIVEYMRSVILLKAEPKDALDAMTKDVTALLPKK